MSEPIEHCPLCNTHTSFELGKMEFENDDTPEKTTIAYDVQNETCLNPNCKNYQVVLNKIKHRRD